MPIPPDVLDTLIKAGGWAFAAIIAGAFVWLFVTDRIHSDRSFQREVKRGDDNAAEVEEMTAAAAKGQEQFEAILANGKQLTEVVSKVLAALGGHTG